MMSNVLKPELIWIEGRCYRAGDSLEAGSFHQEYDMYENEQELNTYEGEDDDGFEITALSDNRYSTSFHVPKYYFGSVIGRKGAVKMRVERDTKTEIKIPKHGHDGDIVILGSNPGNVKAARRRINMIVFATRQKLSSTHFISIPMNNDKIKENFIKFKQEVLQDGSDKRIEESLFISPSKLHLTITVMCLMDNEERLQASTLLQNAAAEIIRPKLKLYNPLQVKMKGLSYMNDDPKDVHILYSNVQEVNAQPGFLQELADDIFQYSSKSGLVNDFSSRTNVKLHVTVMNSKYRQNSDDVRSQFSKRKSFDATQVLEKYSDFDFGVMDVTSVCLSQMSTVGEDGYYQNTCTLLV